MGNRSEYQALKSDNYGPPSGQSGSTCPLAILSFIVLELAVYAILEVVGVEDRTITVGVYLIASAAIFLFVTHCYQPNDVGVEQLSTSLKVSLHVLAILGLLLIITQNGGMKLSLQLTSKGDEVLSNKMQSSSNRWDRMVSSSWNRPSSVEIVDCKPKVKAMLDKVDTVIFDLFGTLLDLDNNPQEGAATFVNKLHQMGKKVLITTNNFKFSRSEIFAKLADGGVTNLDIRDILTSTSMTAVYLKEKRINGKVYLFDSHQFEYELSLLNITSVGSGPDIGFGNHEFVPDQVEFDPSIEAIIVHEDQYVNKRKISKMLKYGKTVRPDLFIALDSHPAYKLFGWPLVDGRDYMELVATAAKRRPVVISKPLKTFFDAILVNFPQVDPDRTLVIGDTLEVDMAFAINSGIGYSLLMGTNTRTYKDAVMTDDFPPNYFSESFISLNRYS
ncbi:Glycerol-3-phosphate phosphatase [Halotydeus destructor]|nr:Glycerol-3-phosphate phosphatase [Halotydeus destructor]